MPIIWKNKDGKEWVTHRGLVLDVERRAERVMSDIYSDETYAIVYNEETGNTERVRTNSCFELFQGPWGHVVPDATEIKERLAKEREERNRIALAKRVEKGKTLCVVRGRKIPVGTTGECIWIGNDRFRRGEKRVGLKDAKGEVHWTSAKNVEVAA